MDKLPAKRHPAVRKKLLEASQDMMGAEWTDSRYEFLLCEIGKIIDFVMPGNNEHSRHLRQSL